MYFIVELVDTKKKISINTDQIITMEPSENDETIITTTNKNAVYLRVKQSFEEILKHINRDVTIVHIAKEEYENSSK